MNIEQLKQNLTDGSYDSALSKLYGTDPDVLSQQRARYLQAAETFSRLYPERSEVSVFSRRAEQKSAATTPTISMDVYWLPPSIWTLSP